jgi:hypothetical protein
MLISTIGAVVGELKVRKRLVEWVEECQNKARLAAAVSTSEGKHDRFSRAETTYDRRFYRALAALLAKRQV